MSARRAGPWQAAAALLILAGLGLIAAYVWFAVILPWGAADQSLRFWYLALLLLDVLAVRSGLRLRRRAAGAGTVPRQ